MFKKVDFRLIIYDHFKTLNDYSTGKVFVGDIFLFFLLPLIIAIFVVWILNGPVNKESASVLITSLSVFSALLFNLLLLIYDIVRKEDEKEGQPSKRQKLMKKFLGQIYSNISFSIFVSVVCIIFLLFVYFEVNFSLYYQILSVLIYYLVTLFLLTLLMVLKRVHVLLKKEIESVDKIPHE